MDAGLLADDLGGERAGEEADAEFERSLRLIVFCPTGSGFRRTTSGARSRSRSTFTVRTAGLVGSAIPPMLVFDQEPIGVDENGQITWTSRPSRV